MNYASIRSQSGGKAPQFYPGEQPLTESRKGTAHSCPKRVLSGGKPSQMNNSPKGS